ncbi:hypothetical protein EU537_11500 [Candidatus Thorarchaeota archaeon]|nr:MAG: hypothetical protein EU537_11500 [Candidatus Thorarchaeota archaeon]
MVDYHLTQESYLGKLNGQQGRVMIELILGASIVIIAIALIIVLVYRRGAPSTERAIPAQKPETTRQFADEGTPDDSLSGSPVGDKPGLLPGDARRRDKEDESPS